MTPRRVAITGIGMVTALGLTREENWTNLLSGTCGMRDVTVFPTEGFRSRIAAEVPYDRLKPRLTPLQRRRWSRSDQFGMVAAMEAVDDSGLSTNLYDPTRIGVLLGACTADLLRTERYLETMVTRGIAHARPSDVWNHFTSTPVDIMAAHFGFEGLRSCIALLGNEMASVCVNPPHHVVGVGCAGRAGVHQAIGPSHVSHCRRTARLRTSA